MAEIIVSPGPISYNGQDWYVFPDVWYSYVEADGSGTLTWGPPDPNDPRVAVYGITGQNMMDYVILRFEGGWTPGEVVTSTRIIPVGRGNRFKVSIDPHAAGEGEVVHMRTAGDSGMFSIPGSAAVRIFSQVEKAATPSPPPEPPPEPTPEEGSVGGFVKDAYTQEVLTSGVVRRLDTGTTVNIDGTGYFDFDVLPAGQTITFRAEVPGYDQAQVTATVIANQTVTVGFALTPTEVPPEPPPEPTEGQVYFETTPSGAKILFGPDDTGQVTPATITKPLGTYAVFLQLEGYVTARVDAVVEAPPTVNEYRLNLIPEEIPPAPLPWDPFITWLAGIGQAIWDGIANTLNEVYNLIFGHYPSEDEVLEITGTAATWWPAFNVFSKAIYGVDLKTGDPSTWEDITPEELGWAIIDFALGTLTITALSKIGSSLAGKTGLRVGPQALSSAEATLVTELGRTSAMATAGLSSLIQIPSAKWVILTIASAMGIDAWATWAATDNIAVTVTMNIRELRDRVEDGTITKEEALVQLEGVRTYFNAAKGFVDISAAVNPILWFLAPTFQLNMELAEEYITNLEEQITTLVPGVPADVYTAINSMRDQIETRYFTARDFIEELQYKAVIEQVDVDQANLYIEAAVAATDELAGYLEEQRTILEAALVYETHRAWLDAKIASIEAQQARIPAVTPPEELRETGTFEITTSPAVVEVTEAGNVVGVSGPDGRLTIEAAPGTHTYVFSKTGYRDTTITRSISKQETRVITVTLPVEEISPTTGIMEVTTSPPEVEVSTAEGLLGVTDSTGFLSVEMPGGTYSVILSKDGYKTTLRTALIRLGEKTILSVALTPEEEVSKLWRVDIEAKDPEGNTLSAAVFINGSLYDYRTPTWVLLNPGSYTFRFELAGFESVEIPLELEEIV